MDLIVFFWLFSSFLGTVHAGTCNMTPLNAGDTIAVPTAVPTYTNNAPSIVIGPPAGAYPTAMPTVTVNGVNPTSWSDFSGTLAPSPGAVGTTGRTTWTWPANTNLRATPTTNSYLTACTPTTAPVAFSSGRAVGNNDCVVLPYTGYWHISGVVNLATGSGGTLFSTYYTNVGTSSDILLCSGVASNAVVPCPFAITVKITSAPSTFYIDTTCSNTACYSNGVFYSNLHTEYKGPL